MQTLDTIFNIRDFGAVADGVTLNTSAIQQTIDCCHEAGGGQVLIPAGVFMSGGLFLKSQVELHLSPGAILRGVQDVAAFPDIACDIHGYAIRHWKTSLITALGQENIAITGSGTVDGQGAPWWKAQNLDTAGARRPPLVAINDCRRVLLRDITLMNAPFWTLRIFVSRDITVDRMRVINPWNHYCNNDGINFVSCQDVRVTNCQLDTGDDGITLKSVPDFTTAHFNHIDHNKPHIPCEDILVQNCIVRHAHGGVVIGSETVGGIRNVAVTNCAFEGTRAGIKLKGSQFGGRLENLRVSNIVMKNVEIGLDLGLRPPENPYGLKGEMRVASARNLHFSDIIIERSHVGARICGQPNSAIRGVSLNNIQIEADSGIFIEHVEELALRHVNVECRGPAVTIRDGKGVDVNGLAVPRPDHGQPVIDVLRVNDLWIHGCSVAEGAGVFLGLVGDANDEITLTDNRLSKAEREQAPFEAAPVWTTYSHAFSGIQSQRRLDAGEAQSREGVVKRRAWLPVPRAVMDVLEARWPQASIDRIDIVCRVESGARPDVVLETGTDRRVYIIQALGVSEKLFIIENGEIYRIVDDPDYQANRFDGD